MKNVEEKGFGRRWVERARLTDSTFYIQDIALCPSHLGLKLVSLIIFIPQAAVAADGRLRIYEAMDVMHLSQWTLVVISLFLMK
jgi:nucleoporin SEH1